MHSQRGIERSVLGITIMDRKNCKWVREQTEVDDIIKAINHEMAMGRTQMEEGRQRVDKESDALGN